MSEEAAQGDDEEKRRLQVPYGSVHDSVRVLHMHWGQVVESVYYYVNSVMECNRLMPLLLERSLSGTTKRSWRL